MKVLVLDLQMRNWYASCTRHSSSRTWKYQDQVLWRGWAMLGTLEVFHFACWASISIISGVFKNFDIFRLFLFLSLTHSTLLCSISWIIFLTSNQTFYYKMKISRDVLHVLLGPWCPDYEWNLLEYSAHWEPSLPTSSGWYDSLELFELFTIFIFTSR